MNHHWYYDSNAGPGELARLTSAQRSERAAWRSSVRQALAARRAEARADRRRSADHKPAPHPIETPTPVRPERTAKSPALAGR